MDIAIVFKKRSIESTAHFSVTRKNLKHGQTAWAKFVGQSERVMVHFNAYLPEGTDWFKRWMPLDELRKTRRPVTPEDEWREQRKQRYRAEVLALEGEYFL